MARALLALLLLGAGAVHAREPDALAALDECAVQLDPSVDVGYERIAARCPGLTATLEHSSFAPWLPPGWKTPHNLLNAEGLRALHATLVRESAAVPGSLALHPEHVRAVLERVRTPAHAADGWWERFKSWLRALFAPRPRGDDGWLHRLFGDVSIDRAVLRVIAALSIGLLVLLAVAVVVNELRVAGVLRRRTGRAPTRDTGRVAGGAPALRDVDGAAPRAQPALLLELIAAQLVAQERLAPARAFTVREVLRRAQLRDAGERQRLGELAAVSERLRYDTGEVAASVLAAAVRAGRELLAALEPASGGGGA